MRAIHILSIFLIMSFVSCAPIEVVKQVNKATNSVKTSIEKITNKQPIDTPEDNKDAAENNINNDDLMKEIEIIIDEKKEQEQVVAQQKKITKIELLGKNLNQLQKEFGQPSLIRADGAIKTVRFDTPSCRFFIFFDLKNDKSEVEYFEIRNTKGNLISNNQNIEKCFQEIKKV